MLEVSHTQIIPTSEARKKFKSLIDEARGNRYFLITRAGEPAVVIADVVYFEKAVDSLRQGGGK